MAAARTPDGHHVVVDGRRWRASDLGLPDGLRQELVNELMAARRGVRAAGDDEGAERAARDRVQDAKVALGERGPVWWEPMGEDDLEHRREATARALARTRSQPVDDADVRADAELAVAHLEVVAAD